MLFCFLLKLEFFIYPLLSLFYHLRFPIELYH
jgi:hypothetical protein